MSRFAASTVPLLFGSALFLSSALLIVIQPMVARTLLPHLGGNAIAWNACLVFFQATLLAGYFYADLAHRFRGLRWQPLLQLTLMFVAMVLCFVGVFGDAMLAELAPRITALDSWPIVTTLSLLVVVIGMPFLALAAIGPFVQRWFAHLDHPKATDPYFLFVASNLGGLMGLIVYVVVIEPLTPLYAQWLSWKLAATALGILVFLAAFCAWLSPRSQELEPEQMPSDPDAPVVPQLIGRGPATWGRRAHWWFASAIPVALMMATTERLTLDVAPAPILWAVPLALFLLAIAQAFMRFAPVGYGPLAVRLPLHVMLGLVLAVAFGTVLIALFAAREAAVEQPFLTFACAAFFALMLLVPTVWLTALQPFVVMLIVFVDGNMFSTSLGRLNSPWFLLHLTCFYWSARVCFASLAEDRPAAPALTTYYSWIAIGGLAGGGFQLLIAPLVFRGYLEYAFLAALASTLRTAWLPYGLTDWLLGMLLARRMTMDELKSAKVRRGLAVAFDLGAALAVAMLAGLLFYARVLVTPFPPVRGNVNAFVRDAVACFNDYPLVLAVLAPVFLLARPWRCGLALTAVAVLCVVGKETQEKTTLVEQHRNAFGTLRVSDETRRMARMDRPLAKDLIERQLLQGTTLQGTSITSPKELTRMPTAYYHRKGPVGQVMQAIEWFPNRDRNFKDNDADFWLRQNVDNSKDDVRIITSLIGHGAAPGLAPLPVEALAAAWSEPPFAFVGLGTGTLFAYARPFQIVDAYELDPAVIDLSMRTSPAFPYFKAAKERGAFADIIQGDARRNLARSRCDGFYDAIFVDAFNSNAIPTHLLTQEAIELYFQKLSAEGILCIHVSNRHLDLKAVLDKIAQKLKVPMFEIRANDSNPDIALAASHWVFLTRNETVRRKWTAFGLVDQPGVVGARPGVPERTPHLLWTDEHASVLAAVRPGAGWTNLIQAMLIVILFFSVFLGMIEIVFATLPRFDEPKTPTET
jgi:hypothetical protein